MGFSRQEYWSGLPCPPPGDFSDWRDRSCVSCSSCITSRFFTAEPPEKPFSPHIRSLVTSSMRELSTGTSEKVLASVLGSYGAPAGGSFPFPCVTPANLPCASNKPCASVSPSLQGICVACWLSARALVSGSPNGYPSANTTCNDLSNVRLSLPHLLNYKSEMLSTRLVSEEHHENSMFIKDLAQCLRLLSSSDFH